jgi:hypothetical protein
MNGPFGDEMVDAFSDLVKSINEEDGFMWKIWTASPETNEAGGVYLFEKKQVLYFYYNYALQPIGNNIRRFRRFSY